MHAPGVTEKSLFSGGRRILALWLPYLRTDRILRQRWGRSWRAASPETAPPEQINRAPLVVSHRDENAQRILALDGMAEALGLKPGMGIADARAMHPSIEIVEAEPVRDRRCLESLADWCDRYTPLVALDGEDGLFLDITGCAHLFGGEREMLRDLLMRLHDQGFDARGAVASTVGAAWAAARFFRARLVEPDCEAELLAPLPLAALRVEAPVRAGLEGVGLRKVGDVMQVARAPLARRFGAGLLVRLDQALGRLEETVSPRLPVASFSVERPLAEPVSRMEDIEQLVRMMAATLARDLERSGQGARRLQLSLFRLDGGVERLWVGASRPLRDPAFIEKLFHERLAAIGEAIDPGYGFELVRLSALGTGLLDFEQTDLAGSRAADNAGIDRFADRVRARLGDTVLEVPSLVASHLPERAQDMAALGAPLRPEASLPIMQIPERPIRLLTRPELLEVAAAEVPEGPPASFRWRRALHRVIRAEGPERIAPEWWRQPADTKTRDYFRVEDEAGRRYWLYREGFYGRAAAPPRWYMHGLCA